jgi:hypothetical protein
MDEKKKYWLRDSKRKKKKEPTGFELYKLKVTELTEGVKNLIDGIENRGYYNHHIDHKISIKWGYHNNIPEEHIAHIDNLRMLWWKDNMNKNIICEVDDDNKWIVGNLDIYTKRGKV